jgi:hypothetical protein
MATVVWNFRSMIRKTMAKKLYNNSREWNSE